MPNVHLLLAPAPKLLLTPRDFRKCAGGEVPGQTWVNYSPAISHPRTTSAQPQHPVHDSERSSKSFVARLISRRASMRALLNLGRSICA